jgi:hypothetical protein
VWVRQEPYGVSRGPGDYWHWGTTVTVARVYVTIAPSFKDASGCCIRVIDTRGIGIRDTPLWAGTKPPSRRGNVRFMGRRTDFVVMLGMAVAILIFAISIATHQWS